MPHVVNGIGTWYWGKYNTHVRTGRCEQCGAVTQLRTYDTTLYFVFFMVPLVPLKRLQGPLIGPSPLDIANSAITTTGTESPT